MQARKLIGSGLLAVGLMLAGCGGSVLDETQVADLSVREDELPDCSGQDYEYEYYSDATKTTLVGTRGCSCGVWVRWGTITSYYNYSSGGCFAQ
ncbi:hypothetical protein ACN28E_22835 [Archangium lansingense]|uniref:hypothetical protein n=1 Tax=Archangium lansingense TaxID=2995310 RepID=UPI003B76B3FA